MTKGVWCCILVSILLAACRSEPPRRGAMYTVRPGDTLYSIAWRHGVDYHELARINGIGRDYAIYPGQVLRVRASAYARTQARTPAQTSARSRAPSNARVTSEAIPKSAAVAWTWPVNDARVELTTRPNGGQGLMMSGSLGQQVRAAGAGRVVYTGSGMLGYGQLVIIKHNETFLSAYGHAQSISIRENDTVSAGQPIATMGAGPNGDPMLYFEIRVNGRPVDPSGYLPK